MGRIESKTVTRKAKRVVLEVVAEPGSKVFVAGSFNGWDPAAQPMTASARKGTYRTTLSLPPGEHEYKFVVNGDWLADPSCPNWVVNGYGSLNSLLVV